MEKPQIDVSGLDGNVFAVLGECTRVLKENNQKKEAEELVKKVFASKSYEEALKQCMNYVEFV